MRTQYERELKELNEKMIEMGEMISNSIAMATNAFVCGDVEKAKETIKNDSLINEQQRNIEALCLRLLLTQQPVATDLRNISAALKMVSDMERLGDHAADISEITIMLADSGYIKNLDLIRQMGVETIWMVNTAIEAYVEKNIEKADAVIAHDDVVDDLFIQEKNDIVRLIREDPNNGDQATDLLMVDKYYERIGDHATNIAEWVKFAGSGDLNVIA